MSDKLSTYRPPDDDHIIGNCLGTAFLVAIAIFAAINAIDWFFDSDEANSACRTGVASRTMEWSWNDLVYFNVTCVDGTKRRVN